MKVKRIDTGVYNIEDMNFSEITNLLMILKDVQADINGDCYDLRKKLIEEIDNGIYGLPKVY